jgi:protein NUD1
LRSNLFSTLDWLNIFPNVTHLYIDNNCLTSVPVHSHFKSLELLSLRSQQQPKNLSDSATKPFLTDLPDIRTLDLSNNHIPTFTLTHQLINLQHLHLSSCGLQSLPHDFGLLLPNLRTVNLNFNGLKDLNPLLNTRHLHTLHAAGNRISRLRKNVAVLTKLSALELLDLRGNALSLGFYASCAYDRGRQMSVVDDGERRIVGRVGGLCEDGLDACDGMIALPGPDKEDDAKYLERLDEDTRLRRRVYEILLASGCKRLRALDGMVFDRAAALVKDAVWERLVELGVLRRRDEA